MNLRRMLLLLLVAPLAACAEGEGADLADVAGAANVPVVAADAVPVPEGDPRIALSAKIPGTVPSDLRATPVTGVYELTHGSDVSYVTADGQYVFSGDLFRITAQGEFPNLTEQRRRELRLGQVEALPESEMIVFGKANLAHTITVFTDVDCQWCRQLHSQIGEYNKLGIRVRYLAYPRNGPDTESWAKAEAVWCAKDRNKALTQAKLGRQIDSSPCATPVAKHYALGRQMDLSGTPGLILETGELVPGYMPPKSLLEALEAEAAAAAEEARD